MTYREAWELIRFKHCEGSDCGQFESCRGERCEYYMALQALNKQYYAENCYIDTKPKWEKEQTMTNKEEYMQKLWDSTSSNEGVFHYTIMDMAWSLHVIAEMLMEMRGYIDCTINKYMNGE